MIIAENIKKHREKMGISQSKLATLLGISRSSVNAWEMGVSKPTTQYVAEMAKIFHITTDMLINGGDEEVISVQHLNENQKKILLQLIQYFDQEIESSDKDEKNK